MEVDITCETDKLVDFGGVEGTVSCTFEVIITAVENDEAYNFEKAVQGAVAAAVVVTAFAIACYSGGAAIPALAGAAQQAVRVLGTLMGAVLS